ncbi:hypothetical protein FIM02_00630 [SAR202 cluster bacterium AD-802-E10_MRT_200m]|nr:hypothetical protein [SAR202 cluster bacterium AD-802-E10_MRT_200m]
MGKRVDREIEEILEKFNESQESTSSGKAPHNSVLRKTAKNMLRNRFSPRNFLLSGVALLLTALVLNMFGNAAPISPFLVLGIISFILGYAMFISRTGSKYELRWRGQLVDYTKDQPRKRK